MGSHVQRHPLSRAAGLRLRLGGEAGKVNFFSLFLLLLLAAAIYLGVMLVPPYIDHYKFEEKLAAVANMAHRVRDDDHLRREIDNELEHLGMTLPHDAIEIERDPAHGKWLRISARYIRQVELVPFGSTIDLEFTSDIMEHL